MVDKVDETGVPYVTVTRVMVYYGPKKWVEATLNQGYVPTQGTVQFDGIGAEISSGVVAWETGSKRPTATKLPFVPEPQGGGH